MSSGRWILVGVACVLLLAAVAWLRGCAVEGDDGEAAASPQTYRGTRAYEILGELCDMGPRFTGSIGAARQLELIRGTLEQAGFAVDNQTFERRVLDDTQRLTLTNVIGRYAPDNPDRIVLVTHHDTRREAERDPDAKMRGLGILGANDGGSGTAVLLALAEVIGARRPAVGIDLIFFDGEEWGKPQRGEYCQGSKHFITTYDQWYPQRPPRWVVCLDMVGDADLGIKVESNSMRTSPKLVRYLVRTAEELGCTGFTREQGYSIEDDHTVFWQRGIPAALLIDYEYRSADGKTEYYHTHADTLDKCSAASLEQVGRVLERLILFPEIPE